MLLLATSPYRKFLFELAYLGTDNGITFIFMTPTEMG